MPFKQLPAKLVGQHQAQNCIKVYFLTTVCMYSTFILGKNLLETASQVGRLPDASAVHFRCRNGGTSLDFERKKGSKNAGRTKTLRGFPPQD